MQSQKESNLAMAFVASDCQISERDLRQVLLDKVRKFWIDGVLKQSLSDRPYLDLAIEPCPDAVENAGSEKAQTPRTGEKLLILGVPGAGKTTRLLEITRDRLDRAETDNAEPVPVVFHLCAWWGKHETLTDWVLQELHSKYQVEPDVSEDWINSSNRFPFFILLDGLDEVSVDCQPGCIDAIDRFCDEYFHADMVVTCGIEEYQQLSRKLKFDRAVSLNAIEPEQIDRYLAAAELAPVRKAIHENATLQALAKTPLTLSAIAREASPLKEGEGCEHLFELYIESRFDRLLRETNYAGENVRHWLSWLAHNMSKNHQNLFLIEELHQNWLPSNVHKQIYTLGIWAIGGILTGPAIGLSSGLIGGLIMGSLRGPLGFLVFRWIGKTTAVLGLRLLARQAIALMARLVRPLTALLVRWLPRSLASRAWVWLNRKLWRSLLQFPPRYVSTILFRRLTPKLIRRLMGKVLPRLDGGIEIEAVPNQRIWEAAQNAAIVGVFGSLGVGAIAILFDLSISNAAIAGLLLGVFAAGGICIEHVLLRFLLSFSGCIPGWNYAAFLDWAAECGFLYKVGGGYIFIHRQLQHHLARLNLDTIQ